MYAICGSFSAVFLVRTGYFRYHAGKPSEWLGRRQEMQPNGHLAEIITGGFARSDAAPELVSLSPARSQLRRTIAMLHRCEKEAPAAAEPLNRLTNVVSEDQQMRLRLGELYRRDLALSGEWLAQGKVGPDPGPSADTRELNDRIQSGLDELEAAKTAIPRYRTMHETPPGRMLL
jgi:hypothetical protein